MAPVRKRPRLDDSSATLIESSILQQEDVQPTDNTKSESTKQPAESKKAQPSRSLFVRSLAPTTTSESLAELFSDSFPVKHATAVTDSETKTCRGYGFVTFADAEDAVKAKLAFNGKTVDGKKIRVEIAEARDRDGAGGKNEAKEKREKERSEAQESTKLIVRNLPWTIKKKEHLVAMFQMYGKIKDAYIPLRSGGLHPGFGFVVMRSRKLAEKAIAGQNGKEIDGRTIAVDWAVKKEVYEKMNREEQEEDAADVDDDENEIKVIADGEVEDLEDENIHDEDDEDDDDELEDETDEEMEEMEANKAEDRSATLFVRNLPFTCTDEALDDHFSAFGGVRYARVVMDPVTDRPKGTGFVCFYDKSVADDCFMKAPSKLSASRFAPANAAKAANSSTTILQNADADASGKYTLDGRLLEISRAVDKSEAKRLTQESAEQRTRREKDKRRLYLLAEGSINSKSKLWQSLPPSEQKLRDASAKQRKQLIESNPSLNLSLTRLSVRNIPRNIGSKELKAIAREAIVGFATDVKEGKRTKLSEEELARGGDEMKDADRSRRVSKKGVVKQAKVVFEAEGGSKVEERSGAGRSRGYGFIEYHTHRNALMGLRWLNGHSIDYRVKDPEAKVDRDALQDRKKRLIVEFAIENANVVMRRQDREQKAKGRPRENGDGKASAKRKRDDEAVETESVEVSGKDAIDAKTAQRNRIIGRKRMLRRNKKNQK